MVRVLLVEDNQSVLEGIVFELQIHGYEVHTAINGRQALQYLESAPDLPDVIVSDIAMPEMNGYELLDIVQQHTHWTRIPFIFLTAYGTEDEVRFGKRSGVDDYLVKPFRADDLIVAIENKIRRTAQITASAEQHLDQVRHELITLISHELRTPMASIYGGTELLVEMLVDWQDAQAQTALDIVRLGANRMNRLMQQLLLILEIDSGFLSEQIKKHARPVDLFEVVTQGGSQLFQQHPERRADFNLHPPTAPVYILGLNETLVRIIEEVVRNAITFSQTQIDVQVRAEKESAVLTVEDRGIGIRPEDLAAIGQRFKQSNRTVREQQGAGLGLSIVRDVTRLHGGQFTIESQYQLGTRVTISFPIWNKEPLS